MWHNWQVSEIVKFLPCHGFLFLFLIKNPVLEIGSTLKYFKQENVACSELYLKRSTGQHDSGTEWLSDANSCPEINKENLIKFWCEAFFPLFFGSIWLYHQIGEILERMLRWRWEFSVLFVFYLFCIFMHSSHLWFLTLWPFTVSLF